MFIRILLETIRWYSKLKLDEEFCLVPKRKIRIFLINEYVECCVDR